MKLSTRILLLFVAIFVIASVTVFARPSVSKIEPPNWWSGHTINPVRLMIRGKGFKSGDKGTTVSAKDSRLKVDNVRINRTGTYIFLDLTIPDGLPAGNYPLEVMTSRGKARVPFSISPIGVHPTSKAENQISGKDVLYLIMPDRFANGNPANDKPRGSSPSSNDRSNSRAWHGGDLEGVRQQLPYLQDLGVTAIWLTPWYDNPDTENRCAQPWCPYTNYHGYHAIDYYGVENHFGTMADLRLLVRDARKLGIKVIQDQVANHVGHVHPWMKDKPLDTWFSTFEQNSFNNSVLLSPNRSQREYENLTRGWFNELLPDNDHSEPEVVKYQIQNALWWIEMTGISGIRQDTIQYMPREFIRDWSVAILKQYPEFWMVGEIFEVDSAQTAFFQGGNKGWDGIDTKLPSVFDFALWDASRKVFTGKKPARALRDVKKYDGLYSDINNVVFLANNHDTDRFMSLDSATEDGSRLHTAFVLSSRGIPQLYYGEEILMTGGHDPDNRKDFPGGWAGDSSDKFKKTGRTFKEQFTYEWTQKWINLRKNYPAIQSGSTVDLHYDNDLYVFARKTPGNQSKSSWVVVAFNTSRDNKNVSIDFKSRLGIATTGCYKEIISEKTAAQLLNLQGNSGEQGVCPGDFSIRKLSLERKSAVAFKVTEK